MGAAALSGTHLFVHHTTSLLPGCCVARGLHPLVLAWRGEEGRQMLQPGWANVRAPGRLQGGCPQGSISWINGRWLPLRRMRITCVLAFPRRPTTTTSHPIAISGPSSMHPSARCPCWTWCVAPTHPHLSGDPTLLSTDAMCRVRAGPPPQGPWDYPESCYCAGICRKNAHCSTAFDFLGLQIHPSA